MRTPKWIQWTRLIIVLCVPMLTSACAVSTEEADYDETAVENETDFQTIALEAEAARDGTIMVHNLCWSPMTTDPAQFLLMVSLPNQFGIEPIRQELSMTLSAMDGRVEVYGARPTTVSNSVSGFRTNGTPGPGFSIQPIATLRATTPYETKTLAINEPIIGSTDPLHLTGYTYSTGTFSYATYFFIIRAYSFFHPNPTPHQVCIKDARMRTIYNP